MGSFFKKMRNKTDILIVHLNGEQIIRNCLRSIYKNTKDFNIYIFLNNSTDGSENIVRKEFPEVNITISKSRIGFAEACNRLVEISSSDNVVFLNNDTVVESRWLDEMLKTMGKHKNCIACQPKVKSLTDKKLFEYAGAAGGFIDKYGYPFCRGRVFSTIERDSGQYNDEVRIFWGSGVCLLVKREFYKKFGGFDNYLFMYGEELDFCFRSNIYGKEIWFSPKATIYHIGSFSINSNKLSFKKAYLISRNHLIIILKNYSTLELIKIIPLRIIMEIISSIRFFPEKTLPGFASLFSLPFIFLFKIVKQRKDIQKNRVLKDRELSNIIYQKSIPISYFVKHIKTFSQLNLQK
jgi:GT2 family glycosyltransferase